MASARCPVCEDIITIGIPLKLNQLVTCPTCLASLQVVSVNPFELEKPKNSGRPPNKRNNRHHHGKGFKKIGKQNTSDYLGGEDDDEGIDDYMLEKRLRRKPERDKRKKSESW